MNDIESFCEAFSIDATGVMYAVDLEAPPVTQFIDSAVDDNPLLVSATADGSESSPERLLELLDDHVNMAGEHVAVLGLTVGNDEHKYRTILVIEDSSRVVRMWWAKVLPGLNTCASSSPRSSTPTPRSTPSRVLV